MGDEQQPSNGELARRMDQMLRLLQGLLPADVYRTDQKHWERRVTGIERDLEAERLERRAEVEAERIQRRAEVEAERQAREKADEAEEKDREKADTALSERLEKTSTNWRQNVFSGALPALLVLASIISSVMLALRSGK